MLSALCTFAVVLAATPDAGAPPARMSQGLESVATLAPWLSSPDAFRDPKHRPAIASSLEVLSRLQHTFLRGPGASSTGVAQLFARQAAWAQADFAAGSTESARFRVLALTHLCLGCHLREPTRDFADAAKVVERLQLPPLQQAQFYATTRQFDRALELWTVELARPVKLEAELFDQLEALRSALRVAVRTRDDPKLAQRLLAPQLARPEMPDFVLRELRAWQKAAVDWEKERFVLSAQKPAALIARARALVKASGAASNVASSPEHFLTLLRAASYLDEAMRQQPEGPFRAEALYFLGVVHASVADSALWQLEWMYFEACIRENPGTPRAASCAARLKERTWFTWRSGANIPPATYQALGELMALAKDPPL